MRRSSQSKLRLLFFGLLATTISTAQVVAPVEIKDPALRALQFKYMDDLKAIGADINNSSFPYPFYLSRKLDLDEQASGAMIGYMCNMNSLGKATLTVTYGK